MTISTAYMRKNKISQHAELVALFAGFIFVSHPVQTEAVTYVIQRAASLATLFYMATLCFYVKSRLIQDNKVYSFALYGVSILMAIMAMFTKEIAITLPMMIMFYEWSFLRTERGFNWKWAAPFLLTLLIIPLTMYFTESFKAQQMRGTVPSAPADISTMHYLLTQLRVICTYIRLIFLPVNQNLDYNYSVSNNILELPVLFSLAFLLAVFFLIQRFYSEYRLTVFFASWFFITLLPESSLLPIRDVIFEHRLYLPMVGGAIFLASGVFFLLQGNRLKIYVLILLTAVVCFSVLTYQRNKVWKDEFTLWSDSTKKSSCKARPYNNLARADSDRGDWAAAVVNLKKSNDMDPSNADPYYNLGDIYAKQGDFQKAIGYFAKALERNSKLKQVYYVRGCLYMGRGEMPQAIIDFNKAVKIDPNYTEAYNSLGNAYEKLGNFNKAIENYNKALQIDPNFEQAYINLGVSYENAKDLARAILAYNRAIDMGTANAQAYYNRGNAFAKENLLDRAISDYSKAIEINPNYGEVYYNLGYIYSYQGSLLQAITNYTKAIEIDHSFRSAYKGRAIAYYKLKNYKKAFADADKLKELNNGASL